MTGMTVGHFTQPHRDPGHPVGGGQFEGRKLYQTDAAINRADSGGPMFDASGDRVALSGSGPFPRQGASMAVSYLSPAEAGLAAVGAGGD